MRVYKFENDLSLASVGKLWVIYVSSVESCGWRDGEPSTNRVVLKVEHGRARRWILIHELLDNEEHWSLPAWSLMHLDQWETLNEGIDSFGRDLLAFIENNVQTLKQRDEVFSFNGERQGLLKQALKHSIQSRNKIFLIYIEWGSGTNIDDLEGAKESCQNVRDAVCGVAVSLTFVQLDLEILAHDSDQIPNDLQVDILNELGESEEDGS